MSAAISRCLLVLIKNQLKFEDCIDDIDTAIRKRSPNWTLSSLAWISYEDVSQMLRLHIYTKWHLFDQTKPIGPWLNTVISHQISNMTRNLFYNHARPCLKCPLNAAEPDNLCRIYKTQCSDCPYYARWEKRKKSAYDTKLPVSMENHTLEVFNKPEDSVDIEKGALVLHAHMKKLLKPAEYKVYKWIYIDNKNEEDLAKHMGFKRDDQRKATRFKQIENIKKIIITKAKKVVHSDDVDLF